MNDDDFEVFVARIQNEAIQEAKTALGEKGFERWRNPKFCGEMADPDCYGRIKGVCGDTIEMFVKLEGGKIAAASYRTDGCGSSSVACSFAAELAHGRFAEEVFDLTGGDVLAAIGNFPKAEEHCAYLAVSALQDAINNFLINQTRKTEENSTAS